MLSSKLSFTHFEALILIISRLLCWSYANPISSHFAPPNLSANVQNFLQILNHCHFQYLLDSRDSFQLQTFHRLFGYFEQTQMTLVYSIKNISDEILPKRPEAARFSRHTIYQRLHCSLHLFLTFPNLQMLKSQSWNSNPDYVIYFTGTSSQKSAKFLSSVYRDLRRAYYTVLFPFVVFDLSKIYSVCLTCVAYKTYEESSTFVSLPHITQSCYKNANLNWQFIDSDLGGDERSRFIKSCDRSIIYGIRNRPPTLEKCVVLEISRKLNFTFSHRWHHGPYPRIKRRQRLSRDYVVNEIQPQRRQFCELGFVFDQWGYLVVKERIYGYDKALTGPFNVSIWIALLLAFAFLLGVYSIALLRNFAWNFEKVGSVAIALLGSILDQSLFPRVILSLSLHKRNNIYLINWALWLILMTSIVGQGYKGKMFSFLTKSPDPMFPTTLKSLAESNMMVVTYTGMAHTSGQWKAAMLVNLEETIESAKEEGRRYPSYYDKLNSSICYIGEWLNGMREFSARLYVQLKRDLLLRNRTLTWEPYPEEFAVFEPFKHISMQRHIMNLFMPDKWVSPSVPISTFMTTMPWTVNRGYFYPLFKRQLGSIFESGLYDRWDRFHDDVNGISNFYWVRHKLHEKGLNVSAIKLPVDRKLWNGYYFTNGLDKREGFVDNAKAVSLNVLNVVWIFSGILFLISTLTFCIETITYSMHDTVTKCRY